MELKTEEMKREEIQSTFCCTKKGMVFLIKYISFEAYPLLAPKCRVVPGGSARRLGMIFGVVRVLYRDLSAF